MCICTCILKLLHLKTTAALDSENTGKPPFGLNGGGLVDVHMLVLAQGPFEAFGSNRLLLAN